MKKQKSTLRALLASTLALIMCMSMLIGSTFAWFTDSVSSVNNVITAGNLDMVLEYSTDGETWNEVTADTKLFNPDDTAKYEPGYTEVVFLRVSNAGNLAFKYQLAVDIIEETAGTNVTGAEFKLSDYLQIGAYVMDNSLGQYLLGVMFSDRATAISHIESATGFTELSKANMVYTDRPVKAENDANPDTAQVIALVLTMPTTVGNEANYKTGTTAPTIKLGVTALATQLVSESDSFGTDYDKDAEYPETITAEELAVLLTPVDGVITIEKDYIVSGDWTPISVEGQNVTIDGNGHQISNLNKPLVAGNVGEKLIVKNLTIANSNITAANENGLGTGAFACYKDAYGSATFENCNLINSTVTGNERAAGFIAYVSGQDVTIKNCSVVDCEITAVGGAAGLVAYTQVNATIIDSKVVSTKITATEDRLGTKTPLAGAIIGTASGNAVVTLTNVVSTGNTVSNNNATAVHNEMIGRLVGDATLVIN